MKVLVVGDIHGRWEYVNKAFDVFLKEKYDKIIFIGDYADSFSRTNENIIRCFNILLAMKKANPQKVILLLGNHDENYFHNNVGVFDQYFCQGFRPDLHVQLFPILQSNRHLFQYAFGIKNYLFTHAGVTSDWFIKHFDILNKWSEVMDISLDNFEDFWEILNGIAVTSDKPILFEAGPKRGGWINSTGGPLWCDKEEILKSLPIIGLHQIVGHTEVKHIRRISKFHNAKKSSDDTSVTFIDVLSSKCQFLTINIE